MPTQLSPEDIEAIAARVVSILGERLTSTPPPRPPQEAQHTIPDPFAHKLAFTKKELCAALGVSGVTLWRLEARGLLKPVPAMRHKVYSRKEVERFLALDIK